MVKINKAVLIEYSLTLPPLAITFNVDQKQISRTRSVTVRTGETPATRGGYDFTSPLDAARAAHGVSMQAETFSVTAYLDATDRMNDGDAIATLSGIQPEIDTLRSMVEPKLQTPAGFGVLASLGAGGDIAITNREYASVLLFIWGVRILPVFLTSVTINESAHLPTLLPYRAEATLQMQIIESDNPFYTVESLRQVVGAAVNAANLGADIVAGIF